MSLADFKPMLADSVKLEEVRYPAHASPKIDGVRGIIFNTCVYTRSLKDLPNLHIQGFFKQKHLADITNGFDGEFTVGSPTHPDVQRNTRSGVMKRTGVPDFTYHVFDIVNSDTIKLSWIERYQYLMDIYTSRTDDFWKYNRIQFVFQTGINDATDLEIYERQRLEEGWEGTMLRSLNGKYKFGRSSVKEGYLLKRKLFTDGEFEIVGYTEKMHNANEAFVNELGRTDRSTKQENLVPMDTLGALTCKTKDGKLFNVGTGYSDDVRKALWLVRTDLPGQFAKVKYFEKGMVDVPLLPVYIDLRDPLDM